MKKLSLDELEHVGGGYSLGELANVNWPVGYDEGNHYAGWAKGHAARLGINPGAVDDLGWRDFSRSVAGSTCG